MIFSQLLPSISTSSQVNVIFYLKVAEVIKETSENRMILSIALCL